MLKENKRIKPHVHKRRHIAKAITWRIIGTLDTWINSWFLLLVAVFGVSNPLIISRWLSLPIIIALISRFSEGKELELKSDTRVFNKEMSAAFFGKMYTAMWGVLVL